MSQHPDRRVADLRVCLHRVRTRARALLLWHGLFCACAAAALYALAALVAASIAPAVGAHRVMLWFGLAAAAVVSFWWFGLRARRRYDSDEQVARLVQNEIPQLGDAPINAVQLARELERDSPFSAGLVRAYVDAAAARVARAVPSIAVREVHLGRSLMAATGAMLLLGVFGALFPAAFQTGLRALVAGSVSSAAAPPPGVLEVFDLRVVCRPPQYAGLSAVVMQGSDGELRGLKGTQVSLSGRFSPAVADAACLVPGAEPVRLNVDGNGVFHCGFVLLEEGEYRFVGKARGVGVKSEPRPIRLVRDAPPSVRVTSLAPQAGRDGVVEAEEGSTLEVGYAARDDFGVAEVFLEYGEGSAGARRRVALPERPSSAVSGVYRWELPGEDEWAGGQLTFRIGARDNDNISGPHETLGRSYTVRLLTKEMKHQRLLAKQEQLRRLMVVLLGRCLMMPPSPPDGADDMKAQAAALGDLVMSSGNALTLLRSVLIEMEADALADATFHDELQKMLSRREAMHGALIAAARPILVGRLAGPEAHYAYNAAAQGVSDGIPALEDDILRLDDLIGVEHMRAAERLAGRLKQMQEELKELLARGREGSLDAAQLEELKRRIANMRSAMRQLAQQMALTARAVEREFLNPDALKALSSRGHMEDILDRLEELAAGGELERALAEAQQIGQELDEMLAGLDAGGQRLGAARFGQMFRQLAAMEQGLRGIREAEATLSRETTDVDAKAHAAAEEEMGEQLKDRLRALKARAERLSAETAGLRMALEEQEGLADYRAELARLHEMLRGELAAGGRSASSADVTDLYRKLQSMSGASAANSMLDEMPLVERRVREIGERLGGADLNGALGAAQNVSPVLKRWNAGAAGSGLPQKTSQLVKAADETLADLLKDMEELSRAVREAVSRAAGSVAPDKVSELSARQTANADRLEDLMRGAGQAASEGAVRSLGGALQHMRAASRQLGAKDTGAALQSEADVLSNLDEALDEVGKQRERLVQNMQGRGVRMAAGPQQRSGRVGYRTDRVKIPDEDDYRPPEEFREAVLNVLRNGLPAAYRKWNERYYEELVK
jgi:hypothetical protein